MEPINLPVHCDEPQQFLHWSIDEVSPLLILFVLGFILENTIIFTILGVLSVKYFREFKDSRPEGYFIHLMYWHGIGVTKGFSMDNPFRRRFYS